MSISITDIDFFRTNLKEKFGLSLEKKPVNFFREIVEKRLAENIGLTGAQYIHRIAEDNNHPEWQKIVDQVTVPETYFFRNPNQFRFLEQKIIPELVKKKSQGIWGYDTEKRPKIRALSAACSTGEESYSIAISFLKHVKYIRGWDIQIEAFDLSQSRLEKAEKGCYLFSSRMEEAINDIDPTYLDDYFFACDDKHTEPIEDVKRLVTFRRNNLKIWMDYPGSMLPKYDVVFCRNVMIYFDTHDQALLITTLENLLNPGGYLMMGDSETLHPFRHDLQMVDSSTGLVYKKKE